MQAVALLLVALSVFCLVGCASNPPRNEPAPEVRILPRFILPEPPEVPACEERMALPQGSKISLPTGKSLAVGKGGGAYLDKLCLDNLMYAMKMWKYFGAKVKSQTDEVNQSLGVIEQRLTQKREQPKSWLPWSGK